MSRPSTYGIHVDMNRFEARTAQLGLEYLQSIGNPVRNGVKIAIACLYTPLGAAVDGQSLQRVRLAIGASQGSFEAYMALAALSSLKNGAESLPQHQFDPKQNIIKTTFVENKPAGLGTKYLNSGVIEPGAGVELAIICLYGPLGTARGGGTRSEIDAAISESRRIFENYMDLALRQFVDDKDFVRFSSPITKTLDEGKSPVSQSSAPLIPKNNLNGGEDDEINLDEEL